jgi:RimJ/RimL family protein N-acetyltransferase
MAFSIMTAPEVAQAIADAQADARGRPRTDYLLGAADLADDVLVGTIRMTIGPYRSIYCGRLAVCQEQQHQGYAGEIIELGNRFCFATLKAHRVWGVVHPDNSAARQALISGGLTYEGRIRDFFYARGAWHDVDSYSILEQEWLPGPSGQEPGQPF